MKKVIIVIVALIGVSVSAQQKKKIAAQQEKIIIATENLSPEEIGKQNISDLAAFTPLNQGQKNVLLELFTTKARMRKEIEGGSPERLTALGQNITGKMQSVIPADVMEKIKANKALFAKLIN